MVTKKKLFFLFSMIIISSIQGTNKQNKLRLTLPLSIDYNKGNEEEQKIEIFFQTFNENYSANNFKTFDEFLAIYQEYENDPENNKEKLQVIILILFCKKLCLWQIEKRSLKDVCHFAGECGNLSKKNSADYLEKVFCNLFMQFFNDIIGKSKNLQFGKFFDGDTKTFLTKTGFFYRDMTETNISTIEETKKLTVDNYKDIVQERYPFLLQPFFREWFNEIPQLIQENKCTSYFTPIATVTGAVAILFISYKLMRKSGSKAHHANGKK